jgi:hypothetical protein
VNNRAGEPFSFPLSEGRPLATLRHDDQVRTQRSLSIRLVIGILMVVLGGTLLWLPLHTHLELDDWGAELKVTGVRAEAVVYDRVTEEGGNRESSSTTMYLRYAVGGRAHRAEVGCVQVCLSPGDQVSIWVNPADPGDFVTDFGKLSGHRGRLQGGLGVVGIVVLIWAFALIESGTRGRRKRRRPVVPVEGGGLTGRSKHKKKRNGRH